MIKVNAKVNLSQLNGERIVAYWYEIAASITV